MEGEATPDNTWQAHQVGGNNYHQKGMEVKMANVEKVRVSMMQQHAEILRDAIESGAYASGSEAMRDLSAKWVQKRSNITKLKALWAKGKASGSATEVDFDKVLDEARVELTVLKNHDC